MGALEASSCCLIEFLCCFSSFSVLPHGLNCLQLSFPCNRGSPIYSSFAVQCGGLEYTSYNDVVYENDNEALGPTTYYVIDTNRWGVSNVGTFIGRSDPQYNNFSQSLVTNTQDLELFQTARISTSSLRYYGLVGLRKQGRKNTIECGLEKFDNGLGKGLNAAGFGLGRETGSMENGSRVQSNLNQTTNNPRPFPFIDQPRYSSNSSPAPQTWEEAPFDVATASSYRSLSTTPNPSIDHNFYPWRIAPFQ
ncbi:hypothetical protein Pint_06948 [Pistacia integerrima]|uniref:Uncharacterized protein n=1 Tax=Pistacia integerrima TaxID=434235 RepID=A0ACC0Y076_9ROSI|nr:hypothetical protein Pint_06948 [Pistacia integerrima]